MLPPFKCVLPVHRIHFFFFFLLFGEIFEEAQEECFQAAGVYDGGRLSELKEIVSIQQHMSHLRGHKVNMGIIPLPKLNQNGFL